MNLALARRLAALCISAVAWTGLIVQFHLLYAANASVMRSLWIMLAFFTITTNVLVAVLFSWIAIQGGCSESLLAGALLSIVLVGVINALLLWGLLELSGGSALVDRLLHVAAPALVLLYWVFLAPKGGLEWRDPLWWAIYPVAYLAYALTRGAWTGQYAYPFLNVVSLGWPRTTLNILLIAAGYLASGFAVVWIDQRSTKGAR